MLIKTKYDYSEKFFEIESNIKFTLRDRRKQEKTRIQIIAF